PLRALVPRAAANERRGVGAVARGARAVRLLPVLERAPGRLVRGARRARLEPLAAHRRRAGARSRLARARARRDALRRGAAEELRARARRLVSALSRDPLAHAPPRSHALPAPRRELERRVRAPRG